MKLLSLLLTIFLMFQYAAEVQTDQNEWVSLFNGEDLEGRPLYNSEEKPVWIVEDGASVFDPSKKLKGDPYQNIVTDKTFTNFQLSIEWNIMQKGNSGIFWAVNEALEYGMPFITGPEIQVIDNKRHPDAKVRPNYHQAGSIYDMVQPVGDMTRPAGEWNQYLITINYKKNKGSVDLNGSRIVEFPLYGEELQNLIEKSKFKSPSFKGFGEFHTGRIGLQDHGDRVAYRNIKIKEL